MLKQRWMSLGLLIALLILLAACGAPSAATPVNPTAALAPTAGTAVPGDGRKLEVFSWWTGAGEAEGKDALFALFRAQNPGVEIMDAAVAGGGGANAKTVLATRMSGGNPPDSFQVHAGQEVIDTWAASGKLEPLTQFFKDNGLMTVMPKLLLDQITYNGEIWTVPVNIHRSNMLWYNRKVLSDNKLQPPTTVAEFLAVAAALKGKGITPLAIGAKDKFATPHLFESVLLATYGDDYSRLFSEPTLLADPRMVAAITTMGQFVENSNADRSSLSWQDAAQLVVDGKAAMTIMGDWAEGYFKTAGAKPGVDFGWVAAPGTAAHFLWLSDSFPLPKGAANRAEALAWLKVCASQAGQDAFNSQKGSIPARTDADPSKYDEYLRWSITQFATLKLAPSIEHGAAAPTAFVTSYENAVNVFASDGDVAGFSAGLADAAAELTK